MRYTMLARGAGSAVVVGAATVTVALVAALVAGLFVAVPLTVAGYVVVALAPAPGLDGVVDPVWKGFLAYWPAVTVAIGGVLLPAVYLTPVRREIRAFKRELGTEGTRAGDRDPERAAVLRQLAQQANIAEPTLRIVNRSRPESYALGDESGGTVIVTRGLIRQVDDDEFEAVLAHEVSHLANGDSRLMTTLLVPMLLAEQVRPGERPTLEAYVQSGVFSVGLFLAHLAVWAALRVVTRGQIAACRVGVSLLSRGRELAADRGAARLTGSPSALAGALQTLGDARGRPTEDRRAFVRSAGALDILPADADDRFRWLFGTHPDTETRIQHLEDLVVEIETP